MFKGIKRRRKLDKSIILLIMILLLILATAIFGFLQLRTDPFTESLKSGRATAFLFAFSGDRDYRFFEVFFYHPQTHKGAIFFLPANVGSIIESMKRIDRIDVLYHPGDLGLLKKKIEALTGLAIPFVVDLREGDLKALVDLLGGLEVFIPNPVEVEFQERKILLPSGSTVLDGEKTVDFISFHDPLESELDWVGREQKLLQALLKSIGERSDFLLNGQAFKYLQKHFPSNLRSRAMRTFVLEMKKLDSERIIYQRVLGSKRTVDKQELLFPHFDGELLKETVVQTQETVASPENKNKEESTAALEILNGTKVSGLARRAANVFQSFGYDIVAVSNADQSEHAKTVVLDRKGKPELAQRVADLIKCGRVYSRMDEKVDLAIDVTVILGTDFDGRYCKE